VLAERRYRIAYSAEMFQKIVIFGWLLLLNGVLMFGVFQGDKVIIGTFDKYTLHDLGVYSVAFSLTLLPALSFGHITNSLFLPILARTKDARLEFERTYFFSNQSAAFVSSVYGIGFILLGGTVVTTLYGTDYSDAGSFVAW